MSVRTLDCSSLDSAGLDSSNLNRIPFPLPMGPRMAPVASAICAEAADLDRLDREEQGPADEIPTSAGCLRGFCWAIGIESTVALSAYGVWCLWSLLR